MRWILFLRRFRTSIVTGEKVTVVEMVTFSGGRKNGGGRTLFLAMAEDHSYFFSFPSFLKRKNNFNKLIILFSQVFSH